MIGKRVSHYQILEEIGSGGMGVVYKALDTKLDRTVALKFLPPHLSINKEEKKRFIHEARAAATLDHQNICSIYEIGETKDGQLFIAMGYYEGQTLKDKIATGPLPSTEALDIAIQIAEGLNKAHQKDIVHRDIKSANIIITDEGVVKILDFGLAKLRGVTKLTKEGTTLGTVVYMSPEQASGEAVDHGSDIWSLGVLLYEMITGQLPFKGEYEQAVMYAILNETPKPVSSIRPESRVGLDKIINKALAKDPSQRYQRMGGLIEDLKKIKTELIPDESGPPERKPKPFQKSMAFWLILIAAMMIGGYFILREEADKPTSQITRETEKTTAVEWTDSVAVLPFRDFSPEKDQEYFCDGMTDAIIDRLTRLQNLKVTALTSVIRYKNTALDIKDIGGALGVRHIVEGTVQREDDRIRVRAQLIETETGFHLWSDSYDRTLDSVFEVQDDISQSIADALRLTFGPQKSSTEKPASMEAYEYYLKGLSIINSTYNVYKREEDFQTAIKMFEKAIEIDSGYAEAYVGLAWAYQHHAAHTGSEESEKLVEKHARTAYQLNPDSVRANAVMGWIHHSIYEQNDQAYRYLKRVGKNLLNTPGPNMVAAIFFMNIGLYNQAIPFFTRAHDLDPFYSPSLTFRGYSYMYTGDYFKAEIDYRHALRINPESTSTRRMYMRLFIYQKKYAEATKLLEELEEMKLKGDAIPAFQALLFGVRGNKKKALATYAKDTWRGLQIYSALNMKDKAFELLGKNVEKNYLRLKNVPLYDNLRDDPRFDKVLKKAKESYEDLVKKYGDL